MSHPTPSHLATLRTNDHDTKIVAFIIGNLFCLLTAFLSVLLRFWARRVAMAELGSDDWLVLISVVSLPV